MENLVTASSHPLVSIIIPAFNEAENLPELNDRVTRVLNEMRDVRFELLLIDNASSDRTFDIAKGFVERDARWHVHRFSRNFGAEASLAAGLRLARGDAAIILFSDLQEPPELIPEMIKQWRVGYDVVYGSLENRADDSWYKRGGALLAYRLLHWLSDIRLPVNATDYRLLSRPVIEALNQCGESNRYLRGLVHWVGFKQVAIPYTRAERKRGRSTTDFRFLLHYLTNAIVGFSTKPLDLASFAGIIATFLSFLGALLYLALHLLSALDLTTLHPPPAGWTTQTLAIFFFGGLNSFFLGVVGRYVAKIYDEVRRRPLWLIAESCPPLTAFSEHR